MHSQYTLPVRFLLNLLLMGALACASASPTQREATSLEPARASLARVELGDFLSGHASAERVVKIQVVPSTVYLERGRDHQGLDFDLRITGLTSRRLALRFLKVSLHDRDGRLVTYRHLNHNGMNPGMRSLGKWTVDKGETFDLYNPFHSFPRRLDISRMRYMFTFKDRDSGEEFYYGDLEVRPARYSQKARLRIPMKGLLTVLDGHDYYSHHRRFSGATMKQATGGVLDRNFARHAIDLVVVGRNGHLRDMGPAALRKNYDFHITDPRAFHTHGAEVFAPAAGQVVDIVNDLPDLYDKPFDFGAALRAGRPKDLAGNLVVIRHNDAEYSHLFHLQKGSIKVRKGQQVEQGQLLGRIGFSGAATTYVHLHYQLMDGPDPVRSTSLPAVFDEVTFLEGAKVSRLPRAMLDTGDVIQN